jgi:hypothetical protein
MDVPASRPGNPQSLTAPDYLPENPLYENSTINAYGNRLTGKYFKILRLEN